MKGFIITAAQMTAIIILSPLLQGVIKKTKAVMQGRQGPATLQPYRDLRKHWAKSTVLSDSSSWITRLGPYIAFGMMVCAAAALPVATFSSELLIAGGSIFVLLYLLAGARFSLVLTGLDSGSAFAGMGASRDLLFAVMAEPTVFLALLAVGLTAIPVSLPGIGLPLEQHLGLFFSPARVLAMVAVFLIALAETGRLPVDNPDTHLELTMIHEGLLLELTGRHLALVTWGAYIRQVVWFTILIDVFFPWGVASGTGVIAIACGFLLWAVKCLLLAVIVAFIESVSAKMRIFMVPRYLGFALLLAMAALLADTVL